MIKIKGQTAKYLEIKNNPGHDLHVLVNNLAALDPRFFEDGTFEYVPAAKSLFYLMVDMATALAINAEDGIDEVSGYDCWFKVADMSDNVSSSLPGFESIEYDDDGNVIGSTPLTYQEWIDLRGWTTVVPNTIKLTPFGLDVAQALQDEGLTIISKPQFDAERDALAPPE